MPQQRIHEITTNRLAKLKASINEERAKAGEKLLTIPDIIEEVVSTFESTRNRKMKKGAE